jgi:uncharacterized protein YbaP (TraB family)
MPHIATTKIMKKLFIAAIALLSPLLQAQKLDNSLLWKISGNGLTAPSYLFGTIHITCDATLNKSVLDALGATKQLYLELDMDDPKMQQEMMGGIAMKDGKTMSALATPADFKIVDEFLQKNIGMSASMLNTFKPAMVSTLLITKMMDCPMQSFEMELMKVTKEQKEEVYGLEAVNEQMAVFDAIPYDEQMDALVKTAKDNMAADKKEFAEMMAIYKTGNINELHTYMDKSENKLYSKFNDVLLDNRNKNWIPKIEEAAKKTPTFFGVGAAHLSGENGVISLLRKKGYKVEAVK